MSESVVLSVNGMKCGGCESNVTSKLQALDGVIEVSASSKAAKVTVDYDAGIVSLDDITQAIIDAGYTVE